MHPFKLECRCLYDLWSICGRSTLGFMLERLMSMLIPSAVRPMMEGRMKGRMNSNRRMNGRIKGLQ